MTYEVDLVFDGDPHEQGKPILAWVKKHCPSYVKNGGVRYNSGALRLLLCRAGRALWLSYLF